MNPIYLIDFYKVGHISQYPDDVTQVWSNWTPRYSHVKGAKTVVHFGLQYFILKYLIDDFEANFFSVSLENLLHHYKRVISKRLGVTNPRTDHIEWLWHLGYLPIKIYSIPEGYATPLGVPSMVITNTEPQGYWLPNYFETLLSSILWKPSTSATTARSFRRLFETFALASGETDLTPVDWMGHDFSMRGMSGIEDAVLSGLGHLLSFNGTDTVPAILAAEIYYYASPDFLAGSVPATEHSVMSAGGMDDEYGTFKRLLTDVYPSGIVSVVSDTWDLWRVLTDYVPRLKDLILSRNGKLVIRPDSGDPVKIVCGDSDCDLVNAGYPTEHHPAFYGAMNLLAKALGVTRGDGNALPLINNGAIIYGDGINLDRAERILSGIVNDLRLSPYNMVFGIGSYCYEYVTRDTYGFAMKATAVRRGHGGPVIPIWKSPVTDSGGKISHRGIPAVYGEPGKYCFKETNDPAALDDCEFQKVFENGVLLIKENFEEIRNRVRRSAKYE